MTSYALSLTVVVVDPRRLDLACLKNGGKASWHYRKTIETTTIETMSLTAVTEEIVPKENYFLPNIPKNHPKMYKTPHNIDSWGEHGAFGLHEM